MRNLTHREEKLLIEVYGNQISVAAQTNGNLFRVKKKTVFTYIMAVDMRLNTALTMNLLMLCGG